VHPKLTAEQAVAGCPAQTTTDILLTLIEALGVTPEVAANVTAVRMDPKEVELDVVLLTVPRAPVLTVRIPVVER
jgi:hypothetical protein